MWGEVRRGRGVSQNVLLSTHRVCDSLTSNDNRSYIVHALASRACLVHERTTMEPSVIETISIFGGVSTSTVRLVHQPCAQEASSQLDKKVDRRRRRSIDTNILL